MQRPRPNDLLELEIDDLAFGGRGIARHDGFVVFCPDTAPADRVVARLGKVRRRFAEASLERLVSAGPARRDPPCPYVPRCGGCRLQHVDYDEALRAKERQVAEHLARIGHLEDVSVLPADPAAERFGYRNKMEYSAGCGPSGELVLGFHERGRWDALVDVEACLLASSPGNALREAVRAWALAEGLEPYDQRAGTGVLRHVVVREGTATGQALVTVVTTSVLSDALDRLAASLREGYPGVVGLMHAVNDGVAEVASGLPSRIVWGRDWIEERVAGLTLRLSAEAFFQTNTAMTETLYGRVAEAAGLTGREVVYDLFAGVGSIGLTLASRAQEVVGIEVVPQAVADAGVNAAANAASNYRALEGDVGRVLRERPADIPPPDVAVVDPPRAGLAGRAIRRILELGPPVLVYVSCQPATFADNARHFVEGGYSLEWVRPVDMFPQTPHIEAVARFVRPARSR